jgi:class 3 adenylate cyclase/predicted ATPase
MICPRCGAERPDNRSTCPSCGHSRSETISGRAERRLVTILFADISGFTALSERLDPEEVREITNQCLEEMVSVVHRYGGTVDKFIGDEVMAIFGAPHAHEDDAERAAAAALEIRQGIMAISERLAARVPHPVSVHGGINTGMVVAGLVGSLARSDYTVLGDAVNIAKRLEDLSENSQILVAETTYEMTQHAFSFKELPPAKVKGKDEPIRVFELLGVRARRRNPRGLAGIETPFVGRAEERAHATEALDALARGRGGLMTVSGPAGVGKSRLLRELRGEAERRGIRWIQAGASSLGQGSVLAIWADAIRRLLAPRIGTEVRSETVALEIGGDLAAPVRIGTTAALAEVLGLTLPPQERARLGQLDQSAVRGQLFLAVRDVLQAQTSAQPLVLVLEDLHWADEASFDLLRFIAELAGRQPLLLIGTYRSDATTVTDALPSREVTPGALRLHLELGPLTEEECRTLAGAIIGTDERQAPVRELLVEQAGGNPFYLEEILRALADQGAITPASGGWRLATGSIQAVLPPSLQGLLLDRIDRLPEQRKRLLQIAAVAGRQSPPELVWEIAGEGPAAAGQIDDLIRDGFLERSESTGAIRFRHALMQEAAYSSLLLRHRRSYHRRVAELLEARPAIWPVRAELPAVLTHHWERAEDWDRVAEWAMRAAEQARRAFAPAEAEKLYARVLTATANTGDQARAPPALMGMADAVLATGDAERALDLLAQALAQEPSPLEQAALERRRGQALARLGMQASAGEAYQRAAACLGEPRPDEDEAVRAERSAIRIQAAWAHLARGAVRLARAAAEEAIRLQVGGASEADANRLLGVIEQSGGNLTGAAERFEAALAIAQEIGDLPRVARISEQLGNTRIAAGAFEAGRSLLRDALEQYRRMGDHTGAAYTLYHLGSNALHTGELAAAAGFLSEAVAQADLADEAALRGRAGLQLGRALAHAGRWDEALSAFDRAGADDEQAAGEAALERAMVELARGGTPESALRAALAAAQTAGERGAADRARIGLATLARRSRRVEEARSLLRSVLEGVADPTSEAAITARVALAHVALGQGNPRPAVVVAAQALALAEEHGPASAAWYARRVYGTALDAAGRSEAAERELRAVVDATRAAGALPELTAALSAWARARRSLGDPSGAADALAELRTVAAALGDGRRTGVSA